MAKIIKTVEIETNTKAAAQGLDLLNDAIEQLDVSSKKLNKTTKRVMMTLVNRLRKQRKE